MSMSNCAGVYTGFGWNPFAPRGAMRREEGVLRREEERLGLQAPDAMLGTPSDAAFAPQNQPAFLDPYLQPPPPPAFVYPPPPPSPPGFLPLPGYLDPYAAMAPPSPLPPPAPFAPPPPGILAEIRGSELAQMQQQGYPFPGQQFDPYRHHEEFGRRHW